MIDTMTPPVLWPELMRLKQRLRIRVAERRTRRRARAEIGRLNDRMLRDIGLHERPSGLTDTPHIGL